MSGETHDNETGTALWEVWRGRIAETLDLVRAWGGGLVTIGEAASAHLVLCHLSPRSVVAEATGNDGRATAERLDDAQLVRLVDLGWLPPGEESLRWVRRWSGDQPAGQLSAELTGVLREVHRCRPAGLSLRSGPCDQPACVVHPSWTNGSSDRSLR